MDTLSSTQIKQAELMQAHKERLDSHGYKIEQHGQRLADVHQNVRDISRCMGLHDGDKPPLPRPIGISVEPSNKGTT